MKTRFINIFIILTLCIALGNTKATAADENYQYALALMQERKEYNTAIVKFNEFINNNPAAKDTPKALFYLAGCLAKTGKDTSAGNTYEQLIKLYPETEDKLLLQAYGYGADAYFRAEKYEKAITLYNALIAKYNSTKEYETALYWSAEAHNRLLQQNKNDKELYAKAIALYQRLEKDYPDSRFLHDSQLSAGLLAFSFKDYANAIAFISKYTQNTALLTPEKNELALYHLGESLYWQNKYTQAQQVFTSLIKDFPQGKYLAESYSGNGWCAYSMNDQLVAAKNFAKAALSFKNNTQALSAHFDAAVAYSQAGLKEEAEKEYKYLTQQKSLHPKLQTAQLKLGILLKNNNKLQEAEQLLTAAYICSEKYATSAATTEAGILLTEILIQNNKYQQAAKIYNNIAATYPKNKYAAFALYQLALTQAKLKKFQDASNSIKKLLRNYPDSKLRLQAAYAIADYQNILGKHKKSRIAYKWLADKAQDWTEQYIKTNNITDPEKFTAEAEYIAAAALLRLAESLYTQKDNPQAKNQAKDYFTDYIERFSDNPRVSAALLRLGELTEQKNTQIAEKYFRNALLNIKNIPDDKIDNELNNITLHAEYRLCLNILLQAQHNSDNDQRNKLYTTALKHINDFIEKYTNKATANKLLPQIIYYRAEAERYFDNNKNACENYLASYQADKKSSTADSALFSCALIEHKEGKSKDAAGKFETLLIDYPKSQYYDNALLILATYKRKEGNLTAAHEYLDDLLTNFPTSEFIPTAKLEKARIYQKENNLENAEKLLLDLLNNSIHNNEISASALYNLSLLYGTRLENSTLSAKEKADVKSKLVHNLQKLITDYTDYKNTYLAKIQLAEINYKDKNYEQALMLYQSVLNSSDKLADKIHYRLAWCYSKLAESNTKYQDGILNEFLMICNNYPESLLFTESAVRAAKILRDNKEYVKALELYNQITEKDISNKNLAMNALYGKGITQLQLKDYNQAFTSFTSYIKKFSDSPLIHEANWGAGQAALMLGATADAADYFNIAKAGGYKGKVAAQARFGLGLIALETNDYQQARDEFRKVDVFHPQWQEVAASALLKAAEASQKLGEDDTAENDLKRIVELYSTTPSAKIAEELLLTEIK